MSLRATAVRGGIYLFLRHGLGIAISGVGLILLTRNIGPGAYGLYAAAVGIHLYLSTLCKWGVDVYLIRRTEDPQPRDYHQAFTLLLILSSVVAGSAILAMPLLERWVRLEGFGPVATVLFAGLPATLLSVVPFSQLDRALDYRKVALIEIAGQISFYLVALPLSYQGLGPWAPVVGWWAQQLLTLGLIYGTSGYRPRLCWEVARVRAMVSYGLGYSASEWLWNLTILVNPLVVGRYAGAEAVGQVALAHRLADQLNNIVMLPSIRLSLPIFARLQEDRYRLVKALTEGTSLQLMALGPLLAGFGLVAPWVFPLLIGYSWLPTLEVYPFLALGYLSGTVVTLHQSVLYVLRRIWEVAVFRLMHLVLFFGSALLLVPHLGATGYGWAEIVALPSWILLLVWFQRRIGRAISAQAVVWFTAWAAPIFAWQLGFWVWVSLLGPLIWPPTRRELLQAVAMVMRRTNKL